MHRSLQGDPCVVWGLFCGMLVAELRWRQVLLRIPLAQWGSKVLSKVRLNGQEEDRVPTRCFALSPAAGGASVALRFGWLAPQTGLFGAACFPRSPARPAPLPQGLGSDWAEQFGCPSPWAGLGVTGHPRSHVHGLGQRCQPVRDSHCLICSEGGGGRGRGAGLLLVAPSSPYMPSHV